MKHCIAFLYFFINIYGFFIFYIVLDWKTEQDPLEAAKRFREDLLNKYSTLKPLSLTVDVSFYKMAHFEWASPLKCTLKGKFIPKRNKTPLA